MCSDKADVPYIRVIRALDSMQDISAGLPVTKEFQYPNTISQYDFIQYVELMKVLLGNLRENLERDWKELHIQVDNASWSICSTTK